MVEPADSDFDWHVQRVQALGAIARDDLPVAADELADHTLNIPTPREDGVAVGCDPEGLRPDVEEDVLRRSPDVGGVLGAEPRHRVRVGLCAKPDRLTRVGQDEQRKARGVRQRLRTRASIPHLRVREASVGAYAAPTQLARNRGCAAHK